MFKVHVILYNCQDLKNNHRIRFNNLLYLIINLNPFYDQNEASQFSFNYPHPASLEVSRLHLSVHLAPYPSLANSTDTETLFPLYKGDLKLATNCLHILSLSLRSLWQLALRKYSSIIK